MQKKQFGLLTAITLLVSAVLTLQAADPKWNDNTLSMQTYFPVPYAQYNNIYVEDKFDVGASSSAFTMKVGSSNLQTLGRSPLEIQTLNIRKGGSLTMDTALQTMEARFGNTNSSESNGTANLTFNNVRLETISSSDSVEFSFDTVEANSFTLFGKSMPSCTNASWKSLNFGSGSKYYLVCCDNADDCVDCYFTPTQKAANKAYCETKDEDTNRVGGTWCSNGDSCGCECQCSSTEVPSIQKRKSDGKTYCQPRCSTNYWGGDVDTCEYSVSGASWNWYGCYCSCPWGYDSNDDYECKPLAWDITKKTEKTDKPESGSCSSGQSWNYNTVNGYTDGSTCNSNGTKYDVYKHLGVCTDDSTKCCKATVKAECKFKSED